MSETSQDVLETSFRTGQAKTGMWLTILARVFGSVTCFVTTCVQLARAVAGGFGGVLWLAQCFDPEQPRVGIGRGGCMQVAGPVSNHAVRSQREFAASAKCRSQ